MNPIPQRRLVPPLDLSTTQREDTPPSSARARLTQTAEEALLTLSARGHPAATEQRQALTALRDAWTAAHRAVRMEENKTEHLADPARRALYQTLLERDLQAALQKARLRELASQHLSTLGSDENGMKKLEATLENPELTTSERMQAGKQLADEHERQGKLSHALDTLQRAIKLAPQHAYPWE